jgi:MFS transporter, ACS family, D-galactonate transporter
LSEQKIVARMPWAVLCLLSLSLLINYVDRGSLPLAGPVYLQKELGFSSSKLGILYSAFSWTYAYFLILAGWLVDRFKVNWILAAGFFTWSSATLLTGFAHGFLTFLVLRLLLGIGESVAYPSYSRILVRHFPEQRRGLANSIIAIGMPGGLAVGAFAGGIMMGHFGWRPFFLALGMVTLFWLIPWFIWMPRGPGISSPMQHWQGPSMLEIASHQSLWGTCLGLFTLNYLFYFMFNWLPAYLVKERDFSANKLSSVGFVYLLAAVITPISGWLSDRWMASGATTTRVRKTFIIGGQTICALSLAGCVVASTDVALVLLLCAGFGFGLSNSQVWAITQTLAGPNASGKWTGLQNFVGNWAGILGPVITGFIVDATGGFFWAFALTVLVGILGIASWIFVVGPLTQVAWRQPAEIPYAVSTDSLR